MRSSILNPVPSSTPGIAEIDDDDFIKIGVPIGVIRAEMLNSGEDPWLAQAWPAMTIYLPLFESFHPVQRMLRGGVE